VETTKLLEQLKLGRVGGEFIQKQYSPGMGHIAGESFSLDQSKKVPNRGSHSFVPLAWAGVKIDSFDSGDWTWASPGSHSFAPLAGQGVQTLNFDSNQVPPSPLGI